MNARDHIRQAAMLLRLEANSTQTDRQLAMAHALLSIACTLADMADMDADTRTQPAIRPPDPDTEPRIDLRAYYEKQGMRLDSDGKYRFPVDLTSPGDPDRIPT